MVTATVGHLNVAVLSYRKLPSSRNKNLTNVNYVYCPLTLA